MTARRVARNLLLGRDKGPPPQALDTCLRCHRSPSAAPASLQTCCVWPPALPFGPQDTHFHDTSAVSLRC